MSLDLSFRASRKVEVASHNITHHLNTMAAEVKFSTGERDTLYYLLWRPEEINIDRAGQMICALEECEKIMVRDEARLQKFNPANKWGDYAALLGFLRDVLRTCKENPDADVEADR